MTVSMFGAHYKYPDLLTYCTRQSLQVVAGGQLFSNSAIMNNSSTLSL